MTTTTTESQSPCRCHETPPVQCCCSLVCFDRPHYFCGHLLTDGDLSLQQRYVVEKNKLYHRALDGHGVVCGLKLTCDPQCRGHILVHEGFAIDDCGNDLVVCERASVDIIGLLRSKHLLVSDAPEDEREASGRRPPHCDVRQCFYVTICYEEQDGEYETPFQASCTAGPKECLPTRIRERVRFDVTDKLPHAHSYLSDLEKRLKHCFSIYCDGPIGRIIKENQQLLLYLVGGGGGWREGWTDPCDLFCTLRAHFLHQLQVKPDEYNCGLYDEVVRLRCPDEYDDANERKTGDFGDVLRRLLTYLQHYQFDCAFGELVFPCAEPCEAHCLVLGTVEICNGRLTRVCNTPREYLWAPANFVQVLLERILTGRLEAAGAKESGAEHEEHEGKHEHHARCCPEYPEFKPEEMLREFEYTQCGRYFAATSLVRAFQSTGGALHKAFDFTNSAAIARKLFEDAAPRIFGELSEQKKVLGINVEVSAESAASLAPLNVLQALLADSLIRPDDSLLGYRSEGKFSRVLPDYFTTISPDRPEDQPTVRELAARVEELTRRVAEMAEDGKGGTKPKGTRGTSGPTKEGS
jgi:hypothetical protein